MNLHHLRLFAAVAKYRSFSQAAESLHISQPAVSKTVRELETNLGSPLLERGPGGVRPTEAGRILLEHAVVLFAAEHAAEEALDALRGLHRGTLRIGASTTIATYYLPPFLSRFHSAYPNLELRITSANTQTVADLLLSRELDVALVEGPIEASDLVVKHWREDELVVVAAVTHALALKSECIDIQALKDELIVFREPGSGTRAVAWQGLKELGFIPTRLLEVSSNEAIIQVVAAGLGIGIVSSVVAADLIAAGRLSTLKIDGLKILRTLTRLFLPSRQQSPAATAFDRLLDG
jgi:DNA-binding transcriptional LysR family regulator